ncbi:MAG: acetate--CoA ligase family protein [Desulfobulbaceae bacterium]|uniref:Acetate--CoA ligase family protein n=1 Tax=Candidatus Desulfobia pelagia TaxID=2841692 RepID=A0A8J6N9X2_9BACT|nr:acetate--CoA ligase family protein [Candidatus Desulfobia pelagia]
MLEFLFSPRCVAILGVSRKQGGVGHDILRNLIDAGYEGDLVPVNPQADETQSLSCYPSLAEYKKNIDLSIIALPSQVVLQAVKNSVEAGAKAIIVVSSGFKEVGDDGATLEKEIAGFCRMHKVRLLGPNCLGVINTENKMNASFAGGMPIAGGISIFSQSGGLCTTLLDLATKRHLGISKLISVGNKADITESDLLHYLAQDKQSKVIVGYLEDIVNGSDFVKSATEASQEKPVIIFKSGVTKAGLRAASSHTGAMAKPDIAYGAAFKRSGVIRADTFDALIDFGAAFSMQPLPRGNRVLIITNAGGAGTMAADAVENAGLQVARLGRNTAMALRQKLPEQSRTGNIVDVLGDGDIEQYVEAINTAQRDPDVDAIIMLFTPCAMTRPADTIRAMAASINGTKPVLAVFMGGEDIIPGRDELGVAGLPDYPTPDRAVAALKAMYDYASWRKMPPRVVTRFPVNRRRVERTISRKIRSNSFQIGEVKSKSILKAYGFQIPEGYLATSVEEAVEIAERIGYPVAMKIVSSDIVHKSDIGGVRLNINNRDEVQDSFDLMTMRIGHKAPDAWIDGFYVEKMVNKGLEVIIGMNRDPQFGPMLMFGLGGIFVESMKDIAFHLAPITLDEALQMLKSTRSYEILQGKRGHEEVDLAAIAIGLQRISQLTTDFPEIIELDINPYIVGEIGVDPVVADARMTLQPLSRQQ